MPFKRYNLNKKNMEIAVKMKRKVKCYQLPNTSSIHHGAYSYQILHQLLISSF